MGARTSWLTGLFLFGLAPVAFAHGGAYQPPPLPPPPAGAVPPGARGPGPITPPGGPLTPGPTTGGAPTTGPVTGPGPTKGPTPGSSPGPTTGGPAPTGPTTGGAPAPLRPRPRGFGGLGDGHWTRWWYPNRTRLIEWTTRVGERAEVTPSGTAAPERDEMWRAEARAALVASLGHSNEDIASGAAIALGKGRDAEDAEALTRLLGDRRRQQQVREAAALGLGLLATSGSDRSRAARAALADVVTNSREPERLRAMAVYALGMRAELASVPLLLEAASSGGATWDMAAAGTSALGLCGAEITRPDLEGLLRGPRRGKKRETMRRAYAAHGLALTGDPSAVPALCEATKDADEDVRRAAVMALGSLAKADDDKAADVLVRLLHRDKDAPVRHMAALALGRIGHERALTALRYAYRKGDRMTQPYAAIGLGLLARHEGMRDAASHPIVHGLAERANSDLRGALCIAVGLSGNLDDGAPLLREIVADRGDPELRGHAALALGLIGDVGPGAATLREVLEDTHDPVLRREAALALGMLGDRQALRILQRLVEHGSSVYERGSAAVALGRIGGAEAGEVLLKMVADDSQPTLARAMATVGLGLLLDRSQGERLAAVGADLNWYLFTPTVTEIVTIL